jgi:hypothetical protein
MLFSLSHGQHALDAAEAAARGAAEASSAAPVAVQAVNPDAVPAPVAMAAAPELAMADGRAARASRAAPRPPPALAGAFRYYFPDAPGLPADPSMPDKLDALAASMVEAGAADPSGNSGIPPALTYLGQFIDHDVTANTDRETEVSVIEGAIDPLPRATVADGLANLRDGSLALDSLYGEATGSHAFTAKLAGLMRWPLNRAKMRLGQPIEPEGGRVPLPLAPDDATDLLRLGFLLDRGLVTIPELQALEPELRRVFLEEDGATPIRARAVIGDARNDENLAVAQLHALMLRFHNKLADATGGRSFRRARRLTQWHYQWIVVNEYLRRLCDEAVLDEILSLGAPRYTAFLDRHGADGPRMPMPLEFSVAAFRFGHTMVRGAYDHNRFFGEAVPGFDNVIPGAAPFNLLFAFTGNGRMLGRPERKQLPSNWVIEWDRWLRTDPARPIRSARKLDTQLALPLNEMENEHPDVNSLFRKLAARNLRRGYRLNLPTAQGCLDGIEAAGYAEVLRLTPEQIMSGSETRRKAVEAGHFHHATPLWFYVLKEAEVLGQGERLGPLGTHLVAETLVGLIANDPDSYWNADGGRWSPDRFRPGDPISSLEAVARFAGMLA